MKRRALFEKTIDEEKQLEEKNEDLIEEFEDLIEEIEETGKQILIKPKARIAWSSIFLFN